MKELATQMSSVVTVRHGDRKVLYKPKDKVGFKGVFKCGRKYKAQIQISKVRHYLGLFDTEIEAAQAYDDYARKVLGPKARLNIPTTSEGTSTAVGPVPDEKNKEGMFEESSLLHVQNPSGRASSIRAPAASSYPPTAAMTYPHMAHMFPNFSPFPGYPLYMPHGMQFYPSQLSMPAVASSRIEELPSTIATEIVAPAATTTTDNSSPSSNKIALEDNKPPNHVLQPKNEIPHTLSIRESEMMPYRYPPALPSAMPSLDPLLQQYHPYLHMHAYLMAQQHYFMNFPQATAAMGGSSAYPYTMNAHQHYHQQQLSDSYYHPASAYFSSSAAPYEQSQQHHRSFYDPVLLQSLQQQQQQPLAQLALLEQDQPSPDEDPGQVRDTGQQPHAEADAVSAATVSSDGSAGAVIECIADDTTA